MSDLGFLERAKLDINISNLPFEMSDICQIYLKECPINKNETESTHKPLEAVCTLSTELAKSSKKPFFSVSLSTI